MTSWLCFLLQALSDIIGKIQSALPSDGKTGKRTYASTNFQPGAPTRIKVESALTTNDGGVTKGNDEKPFDNMNNIVANLLLNLTRLVIVFVGSESADVLKKKNN